MKTSSEFVDYVLDQLSAVGVILTSKMFSGVLLKVEDKQLGIIIDDMLYFKVKEPELQEKMAEMYSIQLSYERKDRAERAVTKNWWSVPEEILEDKDQLTALAHEVLLQGT